MSSTFYKKRKVLQNFEEKKHWNAYVKRGLRDRETEKKSDLRPWQLKF